MPTAPFLKLPRLQKALIIAKQPYISPETVKEIWKTSTPIKVDPPIRAPTEPITPPKITLQSPFPIPIFGQFPYIEFNGFLPTGIGLNPVQDVIFGTPKPDEIIIYPSPILPIEPKIGVDVPPEVIEPMKKVLGETPGTPWPILPVITFPDKWPEFPELKLPDIFGGFKDAGKWILIAGAGILGVVLLSSYLKGRSK